MTVKELIEQLKGIPEDYTVNMCIDWTELTHSGLKMSDGSEPPKGQWADELGGIGVAEKTKEIHLLNKHFK